MIIKQTITTRIKLSTNDVLTYKGFKTCDDMLLDRIKSTYVNKCFKDAFVLSINKIISRSTVLENVYDIDAGDFVDLTFEFTGEIFTEKEIIPRCKLVKIQPDGRRDCVVEDKPYIKIAIKDHEIIKHYEVGDSFPCIIGNASLKTISDSVIIKAIPFCSQYAIRTYLILDNKTEIFKTITLLKDIDDNVSVTSSHRRRKEWYEHATFINTNNEIKKIYEENINNPRFKFFLDFMKIEDPTDKVSDLKNGTKSISAIMLKRIQLIITRL